MEQSFHQMDWVRLRIAQAHSVHIKERGGDNAAAQYNIPKSHLKKPGPAEGDLCGGLTTIKAREVRKGKSSLPLPVWAFDDSRIVRAVNRLPSEQRRWVRYAYTADYSWDDESGAVADLWQAIADQFASLRDDSLQKVRGMVYLCLQDYKHLRTTGKPAHRPERIRLLTGVPEGNWRRDWLPRWRLMQDAIKAIDNAALASILEVAGDRRLDD